MSDEGGGGEAGASEKAGDAPAADRDTGDRRFDAGGDGRSRTGAGSSTPDGGVASDPASTEAYTDGRRVLRPVTVTAARDAHITFEAHVSAGIRDVTASPGPVPADQIETLRATYVRVPGYDALKDALQSKRLLVLVGPVSSGRSTTGLHLLDELTGGSVARLDPASGIASIGEEHVAPGQGCLGEIDLESGEPGRVAADRLADLLARRDAYCVLTVRPSPGLRRALGGYWAECPPVDPMEVLAQHVEAGIRSGDGPLFAEEMLQLAAGDEIRDLMGPAAHPAQVAEIAGLLLAHRREGTSRADLDARVETLVLDDRIDEWFSVLGVAPHGIRAERARRLAATRIAIAVFDGMSRHIAESTADDLAVRLAAPLAQSSARSDVTPAVVPRTGVRLLDPDDALNLQATTPVIIERRDVRHGKGFVPGEVVRYRDPRTPSALLRRLWLSQYALRGPMTAWLEGLSQDPRNEVRLRAAQAAGLLCTVDFTHTFRVLVEPAAGAAPERASATGTVDRDDEEIDDQEIDSVLFWRRGFAAVAMDHAARDPQLHRAVRGTLSRWRARDEPALRWTAAIALGYDVGAHDAAAALEDLRILGTPWEARRYRDLESAAERNRRQSGALYREAEVFRAAGAGVEGLFRFGAHREVLDQLAKWIVDRRWSLRLLAVQAVIFIMGTPVSRVGSPENERSGGVDELVADSDRQERGRWPVLLALHGRGSPLEGPAADLVRRTLRSKDRKVALEVVGEWFEQAGEDDGVLAAVEGFLPLLIKEEPDRGRLRGLVREMRFRWEEPLPVEVADRLENVIGSVVVVAGRTVYA